MLMSNKSNLTTKFYTFGQNNSGGYYIGPSYIIIEAINPEQANQIAETTGYIYFDGIDSERDCECCGDRWNTVYEWNGYDFPSAYGSEPIENEQVHYVIYYLDGRKDEKNMDSK